MIEKRIQTILSLLEDKKGENIEVIDLRDRDYITDFVIIVTALAGKHSLALLDELKTLKKQGEVFVATEEESQDWIIADLGDIMIHIFTPLHRQKFNLEEVLKTFHKVQQ